MLRLKEIEDKRRGQGRMYDLPQVLLCCILAVAAGADSYRAIARFIKVRFEWLQKHTGLRAILLGLDQYAVERALRRQASAALAGAQAGQTTLQSIVGAHAELSHLGQVPGQLHENASSCDRSAAPN
jgi:hypothetical protein